MYKDYFLLPQALFTENTPLLFGILPLIRSDTCTGKNPHFYPITLVTLGLCLGTPRRK